MLKMYHRGDSDGSSAEFWENVWGALDPATYAAVARKHCEASPFLQLLLDSSARDRLFIDGGCGHGYFVKYFHDLGYRAAGVDFAVETIQQLNQIDPTLNVQQGDVCALPWADGEVQVYYSGGVVEHFEDGPEPALREARRVIAADGWFICLVPDASWFRRRVLYRKATETQVATAGELWARPASGTRVEAAGEGLRFFQYAFEEAEFRALLEQAGFEVTRTFGTHFIWGLLEHTWLRHAHDAAMKLLEGPRARGFTSAGPARATGESSTANAAPAQRKGQAPGASLVRRARAAVVDIAKRAFLYEDTTLPVLGHAVRLALEVVPNMRVYVARPKT